MRNTTSGNEQDMTADELKRKLAREIAGAKERHEAAWAKFLADAQDDPARAISKWAGEVVHTQAELEFWRRIKRELAKRGPAKAMAKAAEDCGRSVHLFLGYSTGSLFASAVGQAKCEAIPRLAGQVAALKNSSGC